MAHFAKVLNGEVLSVIVAEPEFFETFVDTSPGNWIQTSYNTRGGVHYSPETGLPDDGVALRKNFAAVGYSYNESLDAFIGPKPFESGTLNEETCLWEPPVPLPEPTGEYDKQWSWDESTLSWKL
jgi:hypothetical protein